MRKLKTTNSPLRAIAPSRIVLLLAALPCLAVLGCQEPAHAPQVQRDSFQQKPPAGGPPTTSEPDRLALPLQPPPPERPVQPPSPPPATELETRPTAEPEPKPETPPSPESGEASRDAEPQASSVSPRKPKRPKNTWVYFREAFDTEKDVSMSADWTGDDRIEIRTKNVKRLTIDLAGLPKGAPTKGPWNLQIDGQGVQMWGRSPKAGYTGRIRDLVRSVNGNWTVDRERMYRLSEERRDEIAPGVRLPPI